ncbi:MAG: CocE/NonD family hydrolase [Gaiellales bacterium]
MEERAWITMSDRTRLAARLWLPEARPTGVILEALPYRMDDLTSSYAGEYERLRDEGGLAVCRLDLRGTGSSEGTALDEYHPSEQRDLHEVIAWLAAQAWCNGSVGMYGTSYSGFNSLQMACERPAALRAICAIYATDDRYRDDVHYYGGAFKAIDAIDYCHYMTSLVALPPVPSLAGPDWRERWRERFEASEPWFLRWLSEQHDGPYWRHGSVRSGLDAGRWVGYERIECATMLVAGWADGYRNNSFRTFEALRCPKRLLFGPWAHMSTATSLPGPHLDLVPELCRWFRRWLLDEQNGIDADPPIQVFVRRPTKPEPDLAEHRGEWRHEPGWPLERGREVVVEGSRGTIPIVGDLGTAAWISCAGRLPWGQPTDQREDDARSLCFEWQLTPETEILGYPRLEVTLTSSVPVAQLAARLCSVFPDGTSALVTRGLLNLTQRTLGADPTPLEPGVPVEVMLELEAASWVFEAGHTLRLALAGAEWPNAWPPPEAGTLELSDVRLTLPVVDGPPAIAGAPAFSPSPGVETHGPSPEDGDEIPTVWRVERDVLERETKCVISHGVDYDGDLGSRIEERYEGEVGVSTVDPGRAWATASASYRVRWPEADVRTEAHLELRSDAAAYHVVIDVIAEEEGGEFGRRERRFERTIPRNLA